jgi:hypothetical protein
VGDVCVFGSDDAFGAVAFDSSIAGKFMKTELLKEVAKAGRELANSIIQDLVKDSDSMTEIQMKLNIVQVAASHMLANLCVNAELNGNSKAEDAKKVAVAGIEKEICYIRSMREAGGGKELHFVSKENNETIN